MADLKAIFNSNWDASVGDQITIKIKGVDRIFTVVNVRKTSLTTVQNQVPDYTTECELNIVQ